MVSVIILYIILFEKVSVAISIFYFVSLLKIGQRPRNSESSKIKEKVLPKQVVVKLFRKKKLVKT